MINQVPSGFIVKKREYKYEYSSVLICLYEQKTNINKVELELIRAKNVGMRKGLSVQKNSPTDLKGS
ncbi:hypothetical protein GCM10008929_04130 [Alkalibacterium psychrotolerans]